MEGFISNLVKNSKIFAKKHNIEHELTIEDIKDKLKIQNGLCHFSEREMIYEKKSKWKTSIRRIDD